MLSFHIFFRGGVWEEGLPPPQIMAIKLKIKEMHFKNVDHWVTGRTHCTTKFWTCLHC